MTHNLRACQSRPFQNFKYKLLWIFARTVSTLIPTLKSEPDDGNKAEHYEAVCLQTPTEGTFRFVPVT